MAWVHFSVVDLIPRWGLGVHGALGTNRTCDPLLRRKVLYPLSYEGDALRILPRRHRRAAAGWLHGTAYNALNFNRRSS